MQFRTVWSVPLPVLLAASEQFPDLKFTNEWIEETLEAAGRFILQNGQIWLDESEIYEYCDLGATVLCPKCGIDSVIGSNSGYPIDLETLKKLHQYWF